MRKLFSTDSKNFLHFSVDLESYFGRKRNSYISFSILSLKQA
jgi:hypothetical protein